MGEETPESEDFTKKVADWGFSMAKMGISGGVSMAKMGFLGSFSIESGPEPAQINPPMRKCLIAINVNISRGDFPLGIAPIPAGISCFPSGIGIKTPPRGPAAPEPPGALRKVRNSGENWEFWLILRDLGVGKGNFLTDRANPCAGK